jgi:hypothetical protein
VNAGLPGTGLGGLFYVLLALWMPVAELYATLRGRSSLARWRQVGAHFALACGIVGAVAGTLVAYSHLVELPHTLGLGHTPMVLGPVLLALVLLAGLVVTLRVWARVQPPVAATEWSEPDGPGGTASRTRAPARAGL